MNHASKEKLLTKIKNELNKRKAVKAQFSWGRVARANQIPPHGEWRNWLILAGRGYGKTRTGAETIRDYIINKKYRRVALIGGSINEVINVMLYGESGIFSISPPHERPKYHQQSQTLTWPNGAIAHIFGCHTPEKLRGPQFDAAWIDELAKFKLADEVWHQLNMGLRLGKYPKCIITTTPKNTKLINHLVKDAETVVTRGTTFENKNNLAPAFLDSIQNQYGKTKFGAQELYGEILTETEGALWNRKMIRYHQNEENWRRIIVAIDPAATHHEKSDETGIIVAALSEEGFIYVLEDLSGRHSPHQWGQVSVDAYKRFQADRIIAETNKGGDMVERIIRSIDNNVAFKPVRATRGKTTRAEPIAALYEQEKVFHTRPFSKLEEQLCSYTSQTAKSPDRLDALVWAITELALTSESNPVLKIW